MDELIPHCPSGAVSFCQKFTPVRWSLFSGFLETGEALDDYAKFRSSLMETYASLTMSIASDNQVQMGWRYLNDLERPESYNVAANELASRLKHDTNRDELFDEVRLFLVTGDPVKKNVWDYRRHLKKLHSLHQFFACRKNLAKLDFIKWDSDFNEVFQRLKSEKQHADLDDDNLKYALAKHFSFLRKLNDDMSMIGLAGMSKMPEGDELLEAINNEYSQKVTDLTKDFKERWKINNSFSDHMEAKSLQRRLFDQAESSRTVILPKEGHFTCPKLSTVVDRALVHKSQALEKFLELKGRWGRSLGGLRGKLWPGVAFVGIPVAYMGGRMQKG